MSWFVYMIRACDNSLYTGITTDVKRRFLEHQGGAPKGAKALRGKAPLSLELTFQVNDRSTASRYEYRIKKLSKNKKEQLINQQLLPVDLGL